MVPELGTVNRKIKRSLCMCESRLIIDRWNWCICKTLSFVQRRVIDVRHQNKNEIYEINKRNVWIFFFAVYRFKVYSKRYIILDMVIYCKWQNYNYGTRIFGLNWTSNFVHELIPFYVPLTTCMHKFMIIGWIVKAWKCYKQANKLIRI